MFTLETIVEKFGDEIGPWALELAANLTAAFWKYSGQGEKEDADEFDEENGERGGTWSGVLVFVLAVATRRRASVCMGGGCSWLAVSARCGLHVHAAAMTPCAMWLFQGHWMGCRNLCTTVQQQQAMRMPTHDCHMHRHSLHGHRHPHAFNLVSPACLSAPCLFAPCTAGIAAYGCIKALNTLLESVSSLKHLFFDLEELLFPLMKANISTDGQEVFEEVLEMLAYFTYFSDSISPRLWSLWPQVGAAGQQGSRALPGMTVTAAAADTAAAAAAADTAAATTAAAPMRHPHLLPYPGLLLCCLRSTSRCWSGPSTTGRTCWCPWTTTSARARRCS